MEHDVVIHLYDLSMGMARAMSMAFIGRQLDCIPHTGVVVNHGAGDTEYFYGGGIQALPAHQVAEYFGLRPIERIVLGKTRKTHDELRAFLRTIAHKYTQERYDLFRNNCNNFSNELSTWLCGVPVPDRIMGVPALVLSTPMGQSIASMWTGMQAQMGARMGAAGGGAWDPFTARAGGAAGLPEGTTLPGTGATAAAPTATAAAPAATGGAGAVSATAATKHLEAAVQPLLSAEPGNVSATVEKLLAVSASLPADSPHVLSAADIAALRALVPILAPAAAASSSAAAGISPALPSRSTITTVLHSASVLTRALRTWPRGSAAFPALALLRLLALREECILHLTSSSKTTVTAAADEAMAAAPATPVPAGASGAPTGAHVGDGDVFDVGALWDVVETVSAAPGGGDDAAAAAAATMYGTVGANVMALSVIANAFKTPVGAAWGGHKDVSTKLIETVARELQASRKEVRQMAAAVAFNLALALPVGSDTVGSSGSTTPGDATVLVTDASVQLLGSLLENVATEADEETVRRRLLAAGRLIQREGPAAGSLMATLGLNEGVKAVSGDVSKAANTRQIAAEVDALLVVQEGF